LTFVGCRDLPAIEGGVCGNGVIDGREDCDGFAPGRGEICRPKGSVGECRLDCSAGADGSRGRCPDGWGCDPGGLCRAPTGGFEPARRLGLGTAAVLGAADLDGDGRSDLVTREPLDASLQSKASVYYFDDQASVVESRTFPKPIAEPYLGDISGDGRADLVFTTFLIGVLLGREDRNWVPETFSSYRVTGSHLRIVGAVDRGVVSGDTPIAAITTLRGETGIFIPDGTSPRLTLAAPLPRPVEELAGDPATGHVIESASSPCRSLVLAFQGASYFSLFDLCDLDPASGLPIWKTQMPEQKIRFDPPAAVDHGPLLADLNGDGHLDALIGASNRVYASYGDGTGFATAVPYLLHNAAESVLDPEIPMPLAVGELSGDKIPDFVFPYVILTSTSGTGRGPGYPAYWGTGSDNRGGWTEAIIDDFNGDGLSDVVAASSGGLNLSFYTGTNSPFPNNASVSTDGAVDHLAVGDFDGDSLEDVAFIEHASSSSAEDSLAISFGTARGSPEPPVTVAHVKNAEQVMGFADLGITSLVVVSNQQQGDLPVAELTLLDGSADRLPLALHTLVNFTSDGNVQSAAGLAITVGAFTAPGRHDLFSVSSRDNDIFELWLIPAIDEDDSVPVKISGMLDPGLAPILRDETGVARLVLALAGADLDENGQDEVVGLVAANQGADCALVWGSTDGQALTFAVAGTLLLGEPCEHPAVLPVDVDRDGHLDLVVLTSSRAGDSGALYVFYNDGSAGFSAANQTAVPLESGPPRAFTVLPRSIARPLTLAVVTDTTLELVAAVGRDFGTPETLLALERGTGVTTGDFDGDGVLDLAVADAGDVRLLKGALLPP
jgi:hypothetical protein